MSAEELKDMGQNEWTNSNQPSNQADLLGLEAEKHTSNNPFDSDPAIKGSPDHDMDPLTINKSNSSFNWDDDMSVASFSSKMFNDSVNEDNLKEEVKRREDKIRELNGER